MSGSGREGTWQDVRAVGVVLLLALIVRVPGLVFPLPLHFDEMAELVTATQIPPAGTFAHPFLGRYLILFLEGSYYVVGRILGIFASEDHFKVLMTVEPWSFLLVGRLPSLLAGLAAVAGVYRLASELGQPRHVAAGAALVLALAPAHIAVSTNLRPWSLATAFVVWGLVWMCRWLRGEEDRALTVAAVLFGFGAASIYPMALFLALLAGVVAVHSWRTGEGIRDTVGRLLRIALAGGLPVVIVDWQVFVEPQALIHDLTSPTASRIGAPDRATYPENVLAYVTAPASPGGFGPLLGVLAWVGALAGIARPRSPLSVVLAGTLAIVFLLQPLAVVFMAHRYVVPAFPVLAVCAVLVPAYVAGWLEKRIGRRIVAAGFQGAVLLAALTNPGLWRLEAELLDERTRTAARAWIETHVADGAHLGVIVEPMGPRLLDCEARDRLPDAVRRNRPCYRLARADSVGSVLGTDVGRCVEWLVVANPDPSTIASDHSPEENLLRGEKFERVAEWRSSLVVQLADDTAIPNPTITVYRRISTVCRDP